MDKLDFLALDIWGALNAQHIDVSSAQVRAALPAFLDQLATITPDGPPAPPATTVNGDGTTRHTCTPDGRALPFGRKASPGICARCDELRAGATPRTPSWVGKVQARQVNEAADRAASRAHFAPDGPHARGECGLVCTFGDW